MFKKLTVSFCLLSLTTLAGIAQAVPLSPDDPSIHDNLCLWLRSPDVNYDAVTGVWTDLSGRGKDAVAMGMIDAWGVFYAGPTLAFGSNKTVFDHAFGTAKFSGYIDDLMQAANINNGSELAELTLIAVYKLYNQGQSGAGMTRHEDHTIAMRRIRMELIGAVTCLGMKPNRI